MGTGTLVGLFGCAEVLNIESNPQLVESLQAAPSGQCQGTLRVKLTTDSDNDASGTARDVAPSYNQGIIDYIDELNDRMGGVRGCPVDLRVGEGDNSAIVTDQVIAGWQLGPEWSEVSTLFVFGTSSVKRVAEDLANDGKVVIAGASSGSLASPAFVSRDVVHPLVGVDGTPTSVSEDITSVGYPNVFFVGMDDSTIARGLLAAISNRGGGRVSLVADVDCASCVEPTIAIRHQIASQARLELGRDVGGVLQSVRAGDQVRVQGILDEFFRWEIDRKLADPSYEPVSWLWLGNSVQSSLVVARAMGGVQALIDEAFPEEERWTVRLAVNPWGFSEDMPQLCGEACNDILVGATPVYAWGETERSAGMSDLMTVHTNARRQAGENPSAYRNHHYVRGYAAAMMWQRAVVQAMDTGSNNPSGEDIRVALESFREEDLDELLAGPLTFTSEDHRSQARYNVYTINADGDLVFDSDGTLQASNLWLGY